MSRAAQSNALSGDAAPEPAGGRTDFATLSDVALLGLMLGRSGDDADSAASTLLDRFGSLAAVASADEAEVYRTVGPCGRAIAGLGILVELAVRLAREEASRRPVITSWTALEAYVRAALAHRPREQFRVLYLDHRNVLMRDELVAEESAYRPDAVSPAGAGGLTQLMPGTARDLGVRDRFDAEENLFGGADYLARQLLRFGDLRLALAAYNSGPGRVARLGRIPDIEETRAYVVSVIDCYLALTAGRGVRSAPQCRVREEAR